MENIIDKYLGKLLVISVFLTSFMSCVANAGIPTETVTLDPIVVEEDLSTAIETTVILPESYSRSITREFDHVQYPDQPTYSLTIERMIDNAILVTIALVDTIIDPDPTTNPEIIVVTDPVDVVPVPTPDPVEPDVVPVEPVDIVVIETPACNQLDGTSMKEIYGLLKRWENLYTDTVTPQQAFNSVGSMFADADNLKTRVKAIRMILKGTCE